MNLRYLQVGGITGKLDATVNVGAAAPITQFTQKPVNGRSPAAAGGDNG
jgi:hypothetical protein